MFTCKVCKGIMKPACPIPGTGSSSANSTSGISQKSFRDDDSNGGNEAGDGGSDFGDDAKIGVGKGNPLAALSQSGKRRRFGIVGRPRGGGAAVPVVTNWKGQIANKPSETVTTPTPPVPASTSTPLATTLASISTKKRLGDVRRRGRQPKIRGMVGLQVSRDIFYYPLKINISVVTAK